MKVTHDQLEEAMQYLNTGIKNGWIAPEDFENLTDEELVAKANKLRNNIEHLYEETV